MAPILLKIKGTKLFSPFNEIEDVGDLSTLWRVCTKVKDSLENGSRLENLSWRLWHLHQTLEARGKGRDYRKLSPTTTKQLEKTIRRPNNMPKAKPMQIKVRLGKTKDGASRTRPPPLAAAGGGEGAAAAPGDEPAAAHPPGDDALQPPEAGASGEPQPDDGPPTGDIASIVAHAAAVATAAPQEAPNPQPGPQPPAPTQQPMTQPQHQQHPPAAEEAQVSDFMSFGPSSFLSNGLDLDAPQIEITLDDIFSANSTDWSQFGFGPAPSGQALGMPIPEYGGPGASSSAAAAAAAAAAHGMWGGMAYPDVMPVGAAYGAGHAPGGLRCPAHDGPICNNCGVTSTPLWRRSVDDTLLCNACGLYYKLHHTHRPKSLRANAARKDGDDDAPKTFCKNCNTCKTPLWRRDEDGSPLCNACGLYYKLHNENRPISLKSDVIRKRQRHDPALGAQRKRAARAAHRQSDGATATSSLSASPGAHAASGTQPPRSKRRKSAAGSHDGHAPAPLSAPPISYSANGTQLLNGAVAGSNSGGAYGAFAPDPGHTHQPPPPPTDRAQQHSRQQDGYHHGSLPRPLQHATTLPLHRYGAAEPPGPVPGSITIPTSPPLSTRSDVYYGRAPDSATQMHLPPLSAAYNGAGSSGSSSSSHGGFRGGPAGGASRTRLPHSASAAQPWDGSADPKHGAERQLPSLAELASASVTRYSGHHYHGRGTRDHFRGPQQQQQHPPAS